MDDFVLVEAPVKKPWGCVTCQTQKGPIADTFIERWGENIYLCRYCTDLAAKAHGIVDGPLSQEMVSSLDVLASRNTEIEQLKAKLAKQVASGKELRAAVAAVEGERDEARGQVAQFRHLLGHVAETIGDIPLVEAA